MEISLVCVERATHLDRPVELVFAAVQALLAAPEALVVAEAPRHVRAERPGSFGSRVYDEVWLEAWGEGTGVRYKGGFRTPGGRLGALVLGGLARHAADGRTRVIFAALRSALQDYAE
jgi:hypothetical protein